jgi:hypothetical protein
MDGHDAANAKPGYWWITEKTVFCLQTSKPPIASVHRLRNPGKIPLEIIDMQSGDSGSCQIDDQSIRLG